MCITDQKPAGLDLQCFKSSAGQELKCIEYWKKKGIYITLVMMGTFMMYKYFTPPKFMSISLAGFLLLLYTVKCLKFWTLFSFCLVVLFCLIWFFTSHQQFFSYKGAGLPGLNQYYVLAREHSTVTPVSLEPAAPQSRVKHSTTALPNVGGSLRAGVTKCLSKKQTIWSGSALFVYVFSAGR